MEINSSPLIKKKKTEKDKPKETELKPSVLCIKESYIDDMEIRLRSMRNELSIIGKIDEASLLNEAINNLDSIHVCPENVLTCQQVLASLRLKRYPINNWLMTKSNTHRPSGINSKSFKQYISYRAGHARIYACRNQNHCYVLRHSKFWLMNQESPGFSREECQ